MIPGAEQPETPAPAAAPGGYWRYILVHHSASPSGNAASFDRMHRSKGWDGVGYHFVITNGKGGPDGGLQVSARWWSQKHGAHAGGLPGGVDPEARNDYNEFGIGVCLVGNFEQRAPSRKQLQTLARLIKRLRALYGIPEEAVMGHRHVKSTACPGRHFPWRTLYAMMALPVPQHLHRRSAALTYERCNWCNSLPTVQSRWQPGRTGISSDLPPPVMLRTIQ